MKIKERTVLITLTAAALIVRASMAAMTIDTAADGPAHAMHAYSWSRAPHIEPVGQWLPGNLYLAGLCCMLYPNPLVTPRVLNIILGSATIPLFYLLVREFYDRSVAMMAALALAAMPLHIYLSASSLTEPGFVFFVVAALLCIKRSLASENIRYGLLALFVASLTGAAMTRYEGWALIPIAVAYLYWRTRNLWVTIFVSVVLFAFPLGWMIQSYRVFGNFLFGFHGSMNLGGEIKAVNATTAMRVAYLRVTVVMGFFLTIAAAGALLRELWRLMRSRISVEQATYAILVAALWIMILVNAPTRGLDLYTRLLLLGCTLALPFAVIPYLEIFGRSLYGIAAVALVVLGSSLMAYPAEKGTYVTREMPTDMIALARWLRSSPYRDDAILMTQMHWNAVYLPLYAPQMDAHYNVISGLATDNQIRDFAQGRKHALLITYGDNDALDRVNFERVERVLGLTVTEDRRVYSAGRLEAFDISDHLPGLGR